MLPKNRLAKLQQNLREQNQTETEVIYFREIWKDMNQSPSVCKCSRPFDCLRNLHCPLCGSISLVAAIRHGEFRNWRINDKTIKVYAVGYTCRRCHFIFTDLDTFLSCEAPLPQPSMREVRQTEKANEAVKKAGFADVDDFKAKLLQYREKKKPN